MQTVEQIEQAYTDGSIGKEEYETGLLLAESFALNEDKACELAFAYGAKLGGNKLIQLLFAANDIYEKAIVDDPNLPPFIEWLEKEWTQVMRERAMIINCNRGHNTSYAMHQYYHGERLSRPVCDLPEYFENKLQTGKNAAKATFGTHTKNTRTFAEAIAHCRKISETEA